VCPREGTEDLEDKESLAPAAIRTPDRPARSLVTIPTEPSRLPFLSLSNKYYSRHTVHLRQIVALEKVPLVRVTHFTYCSQTRRTWASVPCFEIRKQKRFFLINVSAAIPARRQENNEGEICARQQQMRKGCSTEQFMNKPAHIAGLPIGKNNFSSFKLSRCK
jgi:hypothetical protein